MSSLLPRTLAVGLLAIVAAIVGVVHWAISPLPTAPPVRRTAATTAKLTPDQTAALPEIDPTRPLRRPLVDPPPPAPAPQLVAAPTRPVPIDKPRRSDLTLIMTVRGPAGDVAVIADRDGRYDSQPVGGTLDLNPSGAVVSEITSDRVTINWRGRRERLPLQQLDYAAAKPNAAKPNAAESSAAESSAPATRPPAGIDRRIPRFGSMRSRPTSPASKRRPDPNARPQMVSPSQPPPTGPPPGIFPGAVVPPVQSATPPAAPAPRKRIDPFARPGRR